MDTQNRSLFISSCTRRQMARRRSNRAVARTQVLLGLIVLAAALGVVLAVRGGL